MAQMIKKKFIGNNEVDGTKILLENNQALRSLDSTGLVEQDVLKLDAADKVVAKNGASLEEIAFKSQVDAEEAARIAADDILQTNINTVAGDLDIVEGQVSTLQLEMDAVESDISAINIEIDSIQSDVAALDVRVTTAESDIDALETGKVNKSGDAMLGSLNFGGVYKVEAIADGTASGDAVNKGQLDSAIDVNVTSKLGQPDGIATLNSLGKLPSSQVPAIAIVDTFVVASEAAMLALSTAEQGDVAVRTDLNKSFILTNNDPSLVGNWQELLTPTDVVLSVNGQIGAVQIDAADVPVAPISGVTGDDVQEVLEDLKAQVDAAVAGADSKQVKVSATDTTEGYLEDKVVGTSGDVVVTKINSPGNEQLQISIGANIATVAQVEAEETARIAADNALQAEIDAEEIARAAADTTLQDNIDAEESARIAADLLLDGRVTDVESDLADHIAQAVGAHAASAISATVSGITGDDVQEILSNMKSYIDSEVSAEESARIAGDSALQSELDATQVGAGLNTDGSYQAEPLTNYISGATSLKNADELLDAQIEVNASAIAALDTRLDTAESDIVALDGRLDTAETAIADHETRISALEGALSPVFFKESFAISTNTAPSTVTLTHTPIANSVIAFVDRLAIHEGVDYSISGTTLTITNPGNGNNQIGNGDTIYVTYQYLA